MKPDDLYASQTIHRSHELWELLNARGNHVPELGNRNVADGKNIRVELRTHYDPYIDGERICCIASVWLDGKPIMIVRNGGRGGKDAHDRFITDQKRYMDMVLYLQSLVEWEHLEDVTDPSKDNAALDNFYGNYFVINDARELLDHVLV